MPVINLHPHPPVLARVFKDLIKAWEWKTFTILFEKPSWWVRFIRMTWLILNHLLLRLPHIEEILKYFGPKGITIRQLEQPYRNGNYRRVFQDIKIYKEKNILLCCSIDILADVLKQAQQIGILTENHQYIITTLDLHTIDLEPYQYGGTNITGIRLITPKNPIVRQVTEFFRQQHMTKGMEFPESLLAEKIRMDTALAYDAGKL